MKRVLERVHESYGCKRLFTLTMMVLVAVVSVLVDNDTAKLIGTILSTLICLGCATFTGLYLFRSYWKATPAGRALLYVTGAFTAYTLQVNVANWSLIFGDSEIGYPWRQEIRATLYVLILLVVLNLIATLIELQRHGLTPGQFDRASKSLAVDGGRRVTRETQSDLVDDVPHIEEPTSSHSHE